MNYLTDLISHFPLVQPAQIFLTVLAIILVVPILMNRLKIPYIIGLIAAGIVVGPYGFNILSRDASFQIFGEVGILYLMFLAGAEIDMYNLKKNRNVGILFGVLTFIIPMVAGILGCKILLNTSWLSASLVATMFASHTLLTYPVLSRFGLTNAKASIIAVCGTIVTVLLALIVLACIIQIQLTGSFRISDCAWLLAKLALYVAFFTWFTPWLSRIFFRKYNDPISQFVYVLAMLFFLSVTAQAIGVAAILGAFFAGLVLNKFIPSRSGLKNRLEFTGNAIFIPYFLIGVGMLINIHVMFEGWGVIYTTLVMSALALGSKWIAAFITQKILRLNGIQREIIFGLSAGKAAATIAATMIGYEYGLIDEKILNGAVVMILLCCIVASITTQHGAIKLRMKWTGKELSDHTTGFLSPGAQLVAVANPMTAEALMTLAALMRNDSNEHHTTILNVRTSDDPMREAMGRDSLSRASDTALQMDIPVKEVMRYDMNLVTAMVNVMKEKHCTELMLGLHASSNVIDSFLGSMEDRLLYATNKMIVFSRCFVPVHTLKKIIVFVPFKAEYETGFNRWVNRVANLAKQLGSAVEFLTHPTTTPFIKQSLKDQKFEFNCEYLPMESWDDFIILSSRISEEDLFICIMARKRSVSYGAAVEQIPNFLNKYFKRHNIALLYPEQFGTSSQASTGSLDALVHTL